MCYQVRFITRTVKCMVTMRWVMARLGNGFGCAMKDERMCTLWREVGFHLCWMIIWCVRSTKECAWQTFHNFWSVPALSLDFKDSTLWHCHSHLGRRGPHSMRRVYKNLCPATVSASIMAANMWENSLKNVECDNNNIFTKPTRYFFYFLNKPCII